MNKVLQRLKIGFQRFILNSIGGGTFALEH